MTKLYEKIRPGDRRTIVKKFGKGEKLLFADKTVIILKTNVAMKVVQEWDPLVGTGYWIDKSYMIDSMVEIESIHHDVPVEDEKQAPLPRVESLPQPTWFDRIFGGFFK